MLTPTFPVAASDLKRLGWGLKAVTIEVDYLGERSLNGRFRYMVTTGNVQFNSIKYSTSAESTAAWDTIGADPEHCWQDAGKSFNHKVLLKDKARYGRVFEECSNDSYVGMAFSLNVTSAGQTVSTDKFITVTVKFHAEGPPRTL